MATKRQVEPKHRLIADELRARIASNEWPPGTTLPRLEDLARQYGTGRSVVTQAVRQLETEGLLWAAPKRGTVVLIPGSRNRIRRGSVVVRDDLGVVEGMDVPRGSYSFPSTAHGRRWTTHGAPSRSTEPIPDRPAEILGLEPGTPVLRRRRVSSPEGEPPYQLADSWIHPDAVQEAPRVADESPGPGGYLDRLEEAGHGPLEWHEIARSRMPSKEEADLLKIPTRLPVMELARVGVSARTGAPIEVTLCVVPGDRVEVVTDIRRDSSAR